MKKPAWVTIAGVLGIIFGICGLFAAVQIAMAPKMLEMQRALVEPMLMAGQKPEQQAAAEKFKKEMGKFLGENQPEWFGAVCLALGLIGLLINGVYIFAAVSLLQLKPYSVRVFLLTLWVSIAFGILRSLVLLKGFSVYGIALLFTGSVGIILDIILLVVIVTANKAIFESSPGHSA